MYKFVKDFNSGYCSIIEKNGELYAYTNSEWNGTEWHNAWKCDTTGTAIEDTRYHIRPTYKEDDDGNVEVVDVEVYEEN